MLLVHTYFRPLTDLMNVVNMELLMNPQVNVSVMVIGKYVNLIQEIQI